MCLRLSGSTLVSLKSKADALKYAIEFTATGEYPNRAPDIKKAKELYNFICENVQLPDVETDQLSNSLNGFTSLMEKLSKEDETVNQESEPTGEVVGETVNEENNESGNAGTVAAEDTDECDQPDAGFLIDGIDTYLISEGFNQTGAACAPGELQVDYEYSTEDYICSVKACINYK